MTESCLIVMYHSKIYMIAQKFFGVRFTFQGYRELASSRVSGILLDSPEGKHYADTSVFIPSIFLTFLSCRKHSFCKSFLVLLRFLE